MDAVCAVVRLDAGDEKRSFPACGFDSVYLILLF